ncbi:hypothetical protein LO762_17660 [Actinocorallia sp. API 0066]|uniref:hypothetical protein n=1 Tax=Actinocorallia sp. API 0066 TaxID=2896846 RepID=UPI001E5B10BC|nr:hypothetical protein [Actinocorallia sp. API 0066]MCD0451009.1 hypothetical protein [Actinocorallia sp. API 0066]
MAWSWRYEKADGTVVPTTGLPDVQEQPEYQSTQSDAESWLGEHWRVLAEAGVAQVWLLDDDRTVYGPLRLALD